MGLEIRIQIPVAWSSTRPKMQPEGESSCQPAAEHPHPTQLCGAPLAVSGLAMKPAAIHCWTLWLLACCPSPGGAQEAAPGPRGAASSTLLAALASTRRLSLDNPPPALAAEAAVIEAALERLHGRGVVLPVEGDSQGGPGPPEVGSSPEAASNSPGAGPQGHSSRPGEEEGGAGPAPGGGAEWRPLLEVTSVDVKKRRHKARTTVVIVEPAPPEDDLPRVRQWEPGEGDGEAEAAAPPPAGEPGAAGALAPAGAPAGPLSEEAAEGQREKGLLGSTAAGPAAAGSGLPATAVAAGPGKPEVVRGHNGSLDGAVAAAGGSDARRPDMVDVNESLAVGVIVGGERGWGWGAGPAGKLRGGAAGEHIKVQTARMQARACPALPAWDWIASHWGRQYLVRGGVGARQTKC